MRKGAEESSSGEGQAGRALIKVRACCPGQVEWALGRVKLAVSIQHWQSGGHSEEVSDSATAPDSASKKP
jgi:hypothetical protein